MPVESSGYWPSYTFDKFDAPQMAQTTPLRYRIFVKVFGTPINRVVARVLARGYERGVINSVQLHSLAAMFDPTQLGLIGILSGRK